MASTWWLPVVGLAFLFLGIDGNAGGLSSQELQERCQNNRTAIFAHPGQCQLYYNCSNDAVPVMPSYFSQYLEECPYPQLFSLVTSRCQPFDDVTCGARVEPFDCDDYLRGRCLFHCIPCTVYLPRCSGLSDGVNVYRGREWSPYYAVCRSQRTVNTSRCPRHPTLGITQFYHPEKRQCVSLYEIPKEHSGLGMNCTHKADGLHLDDVTFRPDVYYHCHGGQLKDVERCGEGQMFDEQTHTCAAQPLKNSIIDAASA